MVTAIKNITLIDGTGRDPVEDALIAIRYGKIMYAGSASGWSDAAGEDVTHLDLRGKFVLPGLIDAHVHLAGSGEADSQFYAPTGQMALKILSNADRKSTRLNSSHSRASRMPSSA